MAVSASQIMVPASELQEAIRRIEQLEAALGPKTLESEILMKAVDFAKEKSGLRARQYCLG
jgi:transposase